MKKGINQINYSNTTDVALLLARVGIAALMLSHGLPKLSMLFSSAPVQFPSVMGLGSGVSLSLAVFAEVLCSVLILVGFKTRLATIPLIITMLVAALLIHGNDPLATREPSLQYLLAFVVLLFAGSGRYSLDHLVKNQKRRYAANTTGNSPAMAYVR